MESKTARDFMGRIIRIGDEIVYPGRQGASMWLNYAIVTDVYSNGTIKVNRIPDHWLSGEKTTFISRLDRVVVVG